MKRVKVYISLTKPGIIIGNLITAAGGFFLASRGNVHWLMLIVVLSGVAFGIASACVFNNYLDRDIDGKMARTKNRALVRKIVPGKNAIIFGFVLGLFGFLLLLIFHNFLTILVGILGFIFYLGLYTPLKRKTVHGTLLGSVSGATPPVAGYLAVTNKLDLTALLLFLVLVFWQMPHFYSIAIFRLKDYKNARIPVLPVKKGVFITKIQIFFYILAFAITTSALTVFGSTGYVYLFVMVFLSFIWILLALYGFMAKDDAIWARKLFFFSLTILLGFCLLVSANVFLP